MEFVWCCVMFVGSWFELLRCCSLRKESLSWGVVVEEEGRVLKRKMVESGRWLCCDFGGLEGSGIGCIMSVIWMCWFMRRWLWIVCVLMFIVWVFCGIGWCCGVRWCWMWVWVLVFLVFFVFRLGLGVCMWWRLVLFGNRFGRWCGLMGWRIGCMFCWG